MKPCHDQLVISNTVSKPFSIQTMIIKCQNFSSHALLKIEPKASQMGMSQMFSIKFIDKLMSTNETSSILNQLVEPQQHLSCIGSHTRKSSAYRSHLVTILCCTYIACPLTACDNGHVVYTWRVYSINKKIS